MLRWHPQVNDLSITLFLEAREMSKVWLSASCNVLAQDTKVLDIQCNRKGGPYSLGGLEARFIARVACVLGALMGSMMESGTGRGQSKGEEGPAHG
jgi:hypothetical protein